MKIKITKKKDKPFTGNEGTTIPYFWYTGLLETGERIQFGSKEGRHELGEHDLPLFFETNEEGRKVWKEDC